MQGALQYFFKDIEYNRQATVGGRSCEQELNGGLCEVGTKTKIAYLDTYIRIPGKTLVIEIDEIGNDVSHMISNMILSTVFFPSVFSSSRVQCVL